MINAVPTSSSHSDNPIGASPMPPTMSTPPSMPSNEPAAVVPPKVLPSHGVAPSPAFPTTGYSAPTSVAAKPPEEGVLAKSLQEKISGSTSSDTANLPPEPPIAAATTTPDAPNPLKPAKGMPMKAVLAVIVVGLIIAGSGAAYYLTTRPQTSDNRNRAASEQVTSSERFKSDAEWKAFHDKWADFVKDPSHTWQDYVTYSQGEGARYTCDKAIMQVDAETNYGCDLNAVFVISDIDTYIQGQAISPQSSELNAVLDHLITNSAILQTAGNNKIVELTPSIFNSPTKDMFARFEALNKARQVIGDSFVKKVDFEAIAIYFHNEIDPAIPLDQAQAAAKAKMDNLYARLQAGKITMKQAGAEIAADKITGDTTGVSLAQLDPRKIYPQNAYQAIINHDFDSRVFTDPVYDDELRSLGEGQMSTVRLCKDYKFTTEEFIAAGGDVSKFPFVDSCYIIFKVDKIHYGVNKDLEGNSQADVEQKMKAKAVVKKML